MEEELRKSVSTTGEAVNKQLEAIDKAMQQEIERVMNAMGGTLASISNQFTDDYSRLTNQMAQVVSQSQRFNGRQKYSSFLSHLPRRWAGGKEDYTDDWSQVAGRYKASRNFICESCGVNLRSHKQLLHGHHRNGVKNDNREK